MKQCVLLVFHMDAQSSAATTHARINAAWDQISGPVCLPTTSQRLALQLRCGHVLEKPQKELGWRRDYSRWKHAHNADRETALLVRLLARVGDVEALQLSLKVARNQVAKAQRIIAQQQVELRSSLVRYYELRQEYEKVTGNGLYHPVKRNIDPAKVAASIKEISLALVTPVNRPAADKRREP